MIDIALRRITLVAGLAAACVAVASNADAQVKWRHGLVKSKADAGFFYMPLERGLFKKHGVDVEYIDLRGDQHLMRALLAGELDSIEASPAVSLNAIDKGAHDVRYIGATMPGFPYALYARKDITNWADLKGKTFGVSAPGSTPHIFAMVMLERNGVDPASIKIVAAGGSAGRVQALAGGKIEAAAASTEFIPNLDKFGIRVMGLAADMAPEYPRFVINMRAGTIQQKGEAVANFLAAYMEGMHFAINNRDETIKLAAKITKSELNDPQISYMFDEVKAKGYLSIKAEIPKAKINWLQDQMIRVGRITGSAPSQGVKKDDEEERVERRIDLDKYIDDTHRLQALTKANLS